MKYVDEYRDATATRRLADAIARRTTRPWSIMEICGGQTHSNLLLVDSIQTGEQPIGHVHEFEPRAFPEHVTHSPHAVGVERLCFEGRARGLAVPERVRIFAVEVADPFTLGTDMTPEVEQAIDDAADAVVLRALEFAPATARIEA